VTSQSAANHAHHPVPTYVATVLWITAMAMLAGSLAWGWPLRDLGVVVLGLAVLPLIALSRTYTVKLQDRIIQLEMQVRCARVLPAGQDELLAELSPKQIVALRFASDAELGDLLQRAVKEQMAPVAIKQAVRQWRPDYLRT
jgi:Family of unknown function (DUF6526)